MEPHGSCIQLGGPAVYGCYATCDFWCSTNWRVETDQNGCEVWQYDVRERKAGADLMCRPLGDGGSEPNDDGGME